MKRFITLFMLVLLGSTAVMAQNSFFDKANSFLKTYVSNGRVDYTAIKANPATLNQLVKEMESFSVSSLSKNGQKAFWINAYNLTMVKSVVAKFPISSPMDVPGIFDKNSHKVAGQSVTLSDIENKILRAKFPDARLHFVLVCGAVSCPPLASYAYTADKLESQLTQRTKQAMNDPQFIRGSGSSVEISQIFEWYAADFKAVAKTFPEYINKYKSTPISDNSVGFYTYDWALNVKKK